jgi:A/G-specific adenine glycosylase
MTRREIACALVLRNADAGTEILLEQRAAANTVMPGMWELPALIVGDRANLEERLTVRHAIMQVNYVVRVYTLPPDGLSGNEKAAGAQRWILLAEVSAMALTGLARKVLTRAGLLQTPARSRAAAVAPRSIRGLV